jgi:hypothetical protein
MYPQAGFARDKRINRFEKNLAAVLENLIGCVKEHGL